MMRDLVKFDASYAEELRRSAIFYPFLSLRPRLSLSRPAWASTSSCTTIKSYKSNTVSIVYGKMGYFYTST